MQCRASVAIRSFIDQIFSSTQNLAMLIGPECSVCSEPTAELAPKWNLIQVAITMAMYYKAHYCVNNCYSHT